MPAAKILFNRKEAGNIFTLELDWKPGKDIRGGQFVMLWVPGVDEIPMSVSMVKDGRGCLTIQKVGKTTEHLAGLVQGDKIGIRGPYGNGFNLSGQEILFIAGGVGIAPILPSIQQAIQEGKSITLAMGGRTISEMAFIPHLEALADQEKIKFHIATDDGSTGHHGFVTDLSELLLEKNNFDQIITCGPEMMMVRILEMAIGKGIPAQFSMERYMKCGLGLCGSCDCDGLQVCKDGPVFDSQAVSRMYDFGKSKRDKSGKPRPL